MIRSVALQEPATGAACQVAPGVLWARMPLRGVPDHVNIFALEDEDSWTLVDTGEFHPAAARALQQLLAGALGEKPVRQVLLTHFHPDHIGQAGTLAAAGARLWATAPTVQTARLGEAWCSPAPNDQLLEFVTRGGLSGLALESFRRHCPSDYNCRVEAIPSEISLLDEGDTLRIGDRRWTAYLGEGHAPGHATYWSDDGLAIMGDHALPGMAADLSVRANDVDADPVQQWFDSCRRFAALAHDSVVCLPGHNLPFTGMSLRCEQLITVHERVLARLVEDLRRPKSALDCVEVIHGRKLAPAEKLERLGEAFGYLNHLHRRGFVDRKLDQRGAWLWRCTGVTYSASVGRETVPLARLSKPALLKSPSLTDTHIRGSDVRPATAAAGRQAAMCQGPPSAKHSQAGVRTLQD